MFIVHGSWLRKYLRWILGALLLILIPGFIALFTQSGSSGHSRNLLPTIHGKPVNPEEFQTARQSVLTQLLVNNPGGSIPNTDAFHRALTREAVLQMIQLRQARDLGIRVSDSEIRQETERQPLFRGEDGQFDYYRYTAVLAQRFNIKPHDFEEMMRQQIAISRLRELVTAGAKITPLEVTHAYSPLNEKVALEYAPLTTADYKEPVTVSDADALSYFEKNKNKYRTQRKVKVSFVRFPDDPAAAAAVTDAEISGYFERNRDRYTNTLAAATADIRSELTKSRAHNRAGNQAEKFAEKFYDKGAPAPDFAAAAAGLSIRDSDYFAATDKVEGVAAGNEFNQAALSRTKDNPVSDPIEGADGWYVLILRDVKPSVVPPFDEVKAGVLDELKRQRTYEATLTFGRDTARRVRDLVTAGKTFTDACAGLKLATQKPEAFIISANTTNLPAAGLVKQLALAMRPGDVSDFVPTAEGGLFFQLIQRWPPDPAQLEKDKPQTQLQLLQRHREALWQAWLETLWRQEQVDLGLPAPAAAPLPEPEEG